MPRQKGQRSCRVTGWSGGVRGGAGPRGWQERGGWGGGQGRPGALESPSKDPIADLGQRASGEDAGPCSPGI